MANAPGTCPTCAGVLVPRELECRRCSTVVRGHWESSPFGRLNADQEAFRILFVRSRGNLSEVERALGVSYPTVRAKLEEVIAALSEEPVTSPIEPDRADPQRREVLERVARGELSLGEALDALRRPTESSEDS
jgi:hypothetical protein